MSFYYTWKRDRELGLDDVYVQRGDVLTDKCCRVVLETRPVR